VKLDFQIITSCQSLDEDWDNNLNPEHPLHSSKVGVTEMAKNPDLEHFYVQVFENNKLILQSYFQQLQVSSKQFNLKGNGIKVFFIETSIDFMKPKLIVAGNLFRHDVSMLKFYDIHCPMKQAEIYEATFDHLLERQNAHGVFLKDISKENAKYYFKNDDYHRMKDDIAMYLDIPSSWASFDDYQKDLKHKYKQRSKKVRRQFKDIEIRELSMDEIVHCKKQMHKLYKNVTKQQVVSMGELSEDFVVELKKSLGDRYKVYGFFKEDEMIAFSSAIVHEGLHDMNYIGMNYDINRKYNLYFNILFHCVDCAIVNNCSRLLLGRTALEAKAIVGCEPEKLFAFYKVKSKFINFLIKNISKRFETRLGEAWRNRHPFKAEHYS